MAILGIQELKGDGAGFGALGAHAVTDGLLRVLRMLAQCFTDNVEPIRQGGIAEDLLGLEGTIARFIGMVTSAAGGKKPALTRTLPREVCGCNLTPRARDSESAELTWRTEAV
jgi:hypothetical protein